MSPPLQRVLSPHVKRRKIDEISATRCAWLSPTLVIGDGLNSIAREKNLWSSDPSKVIIREYLISTVQKLTSDNGGSGMAR